MLALNASRAPVLSRRFAVDPERIRGWPQRMFPNSALVSGDESRLLIELIVELEKVRDGEMPSPARCRRALPRSRTLQDRDDLRLNWLSGDFDVFVRNVNVDF